MSCLVEHGAYSYVPNDAKYEHHANPRRLLSVLRALSAPQTPGPFKIDRHIPVEQRTEAWHDLRKLYKFTASIVTECCGLSDYKSWRMVRDEWAGIRQVAPVSPFAQRHMDRGTQAEPVLMQRLLANLPGAQVFPVGPFVRDCFLASPDGILLHDNNLFLIELKCPESNMSPKLSYLIQLLFQMYCTGIGHAFLVIGQDHADGETHYYKFSWNSDAFGLVLDLLRQFLIWVVKGETHAPKNVGKTDKDKQLRINLVTDVITRTLVPCPVVLPDLKSSA